MDLKPKPFFDPIKIRSLVLDASKQRYIRKQVDIGTDLEKLVSDMYGEGIDMRDPRAEAVRDFIALYCGRDVEIEEEKAPDFVLTKEQKEIIDKQHGEDGAGIGEICKILFPGRRMGNYNPEWKAIREYLEENHGYEVRGRKAPITWGLELAVKKINECVGTVNLDPKNLSSIQKKCCEALIASVKSARYRETYKTFQTNTERMVFESEFIRATWDKPDLTADEINMYITVADSYVGVLNAKETLNMLNEKLNSKDNDNEMTIKLTEAINAKNKEKNDTEKRIESLVGSLNGTRVKRIERQGANKANLIAFFEAFKQADERERLMKIAAMQRESVEKEVDRIENAEEFIARVVGVSKWSAI